MPKLVDLGAHYGTVAFPDEYTPEQIISEYEGLEAARKAAPTPRLADLNAPTAGDYARQVGGKLIRGIGGVVASIPESLAIASSGLARLTGGDVPIAGEGDPTNAQERYSYQLGQAIRRGAEAIAPATRKDLDESFWASKLPEGVGSALGFMAGGLAGRALKIPQWLGVSGLGAAAGGVEVYHDAKASGADEGTAQLASVVGSVIGTSEAIPLSRMMRRLDGVTGGTFSRFVWEAGKDTIEEALQEGAQRLAQNVTAQQLYDKDRELFQDVVGNAGVGGATGFLLSAVTQALGIPIGRSRVRRQSEDESRERIRRVVEQREREANEATPQAQVEAVQEPAESRREGSAPVGLAPVTQSETEVTNVSTPIGVSTYYPKFNQPRFDTAVQELGEMGYGLELKPIGDVARSDLPVVVKRLSDGVAIDPFNELPSRAEELFLDVLANEFSERSNAKATTFQPTETQKAERYFRLAESAAPSSAPSFATEPSLVLSTAPIPAAVPTITTPSPQRTVVEQVVADVTNRWTNPPEVQVVEVPEAFPEDVKADAQVAGIDIGRVSGVTDRRGKVWLNAAGITDPAHATRVIMEEAVGHLGVESVLGSNFDDFMRGVAVRHAATPIGQEVRRVYGEDPITIGREIVAKLAQDPAADPTLWQSIVATVRQWVRQVFSIDVSDNDIRVLLSRARRSVEAGPVRQPTEQPAARFSAGSTSFFPTRTAVIEATSNPGLRADQVQEAEDLAAVQASMVTQGMVGWLMGTPADKVEAKAQGILDYLMDRAYLSQTPRPLSSLPEGTTEEQRAKELAGSLQLSHHAVDRSVDAKIDREVEVQQVAMQEAMAKVGKLNQEQHKANYLTALFKALTASHRAYITALTANAPALGNLEAQRRDQLNRAQERLNEQEQSPTALRNALSAIAVTIPEALLTPTITVPTTGTVPGELFTPTSYNQQVVDWVRNNGALAGVVGDSVQNWLLTDDGTGQPALLSYENLLPDLQTLKDILTKQEQVAADIAAFESWFRNSAATGKISSKAYAEKYFKFRTGRDRALKIVAATEKEIDNIDTLLRANIMARDRLATMMTDPGYRAAVRAAAAKADIVVRELYGPEDTRIGLIDRDRTVGSWTLKGPLSGTSYVVDLHPSSVEEKANRENLAAWIGEAKEWAIGNADNDPLLSDEYNNLVRYVERHLMHPSLDPKQGFTMTRVRVPFSNIRISLDPFDGITALTSMAGYSWHTIRDVIERVGGRPMRQAFSDAASLDTVMRKVDAIEANPKYGRAAQTQAVLKALESHGWSPEQARRWDEQVAEPVLAAGQNRLTPLYEVGDVVVGSGVKLTKEDVAAFKLMKQWGDAIINVAPHHIQDRLADLGITRKAIGNGRFTGHRIPADWTQHFVDAWNKAPDDALKAKLLTGEEEFRQVVLGYLAEFNPEFNKMNPASPDKSPLFLLYRRLADTEKSGVSTFRTWDEVVTFLANEMVSRGLEADYSAALAKVNETLFSEIKGFVEAFERNVLGYESKDVWGGVPPEVVKAVSGRNAFTTPRGRLQAPSTFYSYSTATASRQQRHIGSLRSLLNLKLLQSGAEARRALESKKVQMEKRIKQLEDAGLTQRKARKQVQAETARDRELGNIRYDYREIRTALEAIEQAFDKNLARYELSTSDHYQHAGVAAANNFFSTIKSSLLSSTQAMSTNFWSGALLGPAIAHWQAGQFGRAMGDVVLQPALMAKTVMQRVSAIVADNPMMSSLLKKHAPLWDGMAEAVIKAAADWRRVQQIAQSSGMVNPYNLGDVLSNMAALKSSGGRIVNDDPHRFAELVNSALSLPVVRHATEGLKATVPRTLDNAINYMMVVSWDREVEFLKKVGWAAMKNRETAAATGADWKDLSNPDNVLTPGDLGLKTNKALEWYQQLFVPLGSLDIVLQEFYERTKGMTKQERENAPLLDDDDHAALALQYAAKSNVSTETNRPGSLKGKGSDGVWRNVIGTFMGWGINMMHQLSKGMQTHSKDPQANAILNSMLGLATIVVLLSAVGAWNWEFGDELTKKLYGVSSARVQPGNIQDWRTARLYFFQSVVNTIPMIGSSIGGLAGVAYTGRGNPFDMTSLSPHIGFVAGIYNTVKRISQTGDATLPLLDFTRQWIPMSKIALNRLPIVRGIVDQQNAVRSLNASAPPGTEIVWGKRGGGGQSKYGPANDEIQKLIASAYEAAAHGGDVADVQARMAEAVAAYVAAGRSQPDAVKALSAALAAKEPIRVLTGREMTPEEERKWVARMTTAQKADYDRATAAWRLLGAVTGKDLNMVTGAGGGGGGGAIPSRAVGLSGGPLRRAAGFRGITGGTGGGGLSTASFSPRATSLGTRRRRSSRIRGTRRRRTTTRISRRRLGPRIGRARTTRRRRSYALA